MSANVTHPSGADLLERRKALGLSRQKLAEIVGCSLESIKLFEGGYRPAHSQVLARIVATLNDEHPVREPGVATTSRDGNAQGVEL